ncbi:MAG: ATP-binding protein [Spirochaetes bacterium]|nr:ATP-binding protein [Spirochaetota bacterium]
MPQYRLATPTALRLARQYPVLTLTGPRQSGKTTMARQIFKDKPYLSLEDPDVLRISIEDPRGFLAEYPNGAILDEAQRAPHLFSYIQRIVDERDKPGLFILTGSQNFNLMANISQSLAGRTAILHLLPFSLAEAYPRTKPELEKMLVTGFYPRVVAKKLNPTEAMAFYASTYVERDVRQLLNVKDLRLFQTFIRLCAGRTAQEVNYSALANECGVNHNTIKSWISLLETSFLVVQIRPHHANLGKRLTKSPKLHFVDSALGCYLLGIESAKQLATHPLRGAIFESFVAIELLKQRYNQALNNNLFYFRENNGQEIDLILDHGDEVDAVEIKSGKTYASDFFKNIVKYRKLNNACRSGTVIYGGKDSQRIGENRLLSYRELDKE